MTEFWNVGSRKGGNCPIIMMDIALIPKCIKKKPVAFITNQYVLLVHAIPVLSLPVLSSPKFIQLINWGKPVTNSVRLLVHAIHQSHHFISVWITEVVVLQREFSEAR